MLCAPPHHTLFPHTAKCVQSLCRIGQLSRRYQYRFGVFLQLLPQHSPAAATAVPAAHLRRLRCSQPGVSLPMLRVSKKSATKPPFHMPPFTCLSEACSFFLTYFAATSPKLPWRRPWPNFPFQHSSFLAPFLIPDIAPSQIGVLTSIPTSEHCSVSCYSETVNS